MERRRLGRTGVTVGAVGLGTEYIQPLEHVEAVRLLREALDRGIDYVDLFFAHPGIRDAVGEAVRGRRDKVMVAGHLGSVLRGNQYQKTRVPGPSETYFHDLLARLHTDYIDVLMLHFVDLPEEYERTFSGGPLEMAKRFRKEGKARYIGMSGHNPVTALRAIESGEIDVLMYPVNVASHGLPERDRLLAACVERDVGVVVMKPYAGGRLLQKEGTVSMAQVYSGLVGTKSHAAFGLTPVQCMGYVLAQKGISTVVPGVKSSDELSDALRVLSATPRELDLSHLPLGSDEMRVAGCVYCNHCLPCPVEIDIGGVLRLADTGQWSVSEELRDAYAALGAKASDCTKCEACTKRCPYGVDVVPAMARAEELFERA